jgi:hypothetical protein
MRSMGPYSRTTITALFLAAFALLLSSCSTLVPQPDPTFIPDIPTGTPVPSSTPTIIDTPTPSASPTSNPTKTSTPQPGWVGDFAQPVLNAIAERTPSFQDDFGPGSAGWVSDNCVGSMKTVDGELVITNCRVFRPNTDWRDLVLEVDLRFLKGTGSASEWALHFRDVGNSGHVLSLYHNGHIAISFTKAHGDSESLEFRNSALTDEQPHQVILIARGNRFAFFLDGQPLYYDENDEYLFGRWVFFSEPGAAAVDNLKIWDISKIPSP